jgi:hypothetical protein
MLTYQGKIRVNKKIVPHQGFDPTYVPIKFCGNTYSKTIYNYNITGSTYRHIQHPCFASLSYRHVYMSALELSFFFFFVAT